MTVHVDIEWQHSLEGAPEGVDADAVFVRDGCLVIVHRKQIGRSTYVRERHIPMRRMDSFTIVRPEKGS